jgi:ABC-type glutathione transport system ATPase component
LNVEQRKRLTIGLELAAKPELLVFLDEPTSLFIAFIRIAKKSNAPLL